MRLDTWNEIRLQGRFDFMDQARDDVDRRLLRGEHEVNADRARFLREADDVTFDILTRCHHHVGHFVGNDDDVGHRLGNLLCLFRVRIETEFFEDLFLAELVVAVEVPHAVVGEQVVSLLHLVDGPGEHGVGFFHVGDHGVHQVRHPFVGAQLDHLRVDQQHLHLVGISRHEHRENERVEADALACSGASRDQEVRHLRQIDDQRPPAHVFAQEQRNPHLLDRVGARFDQFAEANENLFLIRHFHADRVLARNRRDKADGRNAERNRQVVGERRDFREPQAGFQFQLELGDDRPRVDLDHPHVQVEVLEGLFQDGGGRLGLRGQGLVRKILGRLEHVERRQLEGSALRRRTAGFETFEDLVAHRPGRDRRIHLDGQCRFRTGQSPRFGGLGRGGFVDFVGLFVFVGFLGSVRFIRIRIGLGILGGGPAAEQSTQQPEGQERNRDQELQQEQFAGDQNAGRDRLSRR